MKIMSVLASPGPGGAEMLVRNLSAEFIRRGHSSHLLFMSDAVGVGNPAPFERDFLDGITAAGGTYEIMDSGAFANVIQGARALRRSLQEVRPDILHLHLARGLMCRLFSPTDVPTVYTHHNVTTNFPRWLFRLFDLVVDRYVAIGAACRILLQNHVRKPIAFIPNGVPVGFSASDPRTHYQRDSSILAVGNLTPKKSYETFVEAAALALPRFAAAGRGVRFAIAGEGGERTKLERLIRQRGLSDHFELLGARSDISALMRRADLLVNSSAHEGLPITLIEAAMSGLPAVATDVGGNAEIVADGESGFIVPPSRPDALADRILDSLDDGDRYAAFSAAALARSRAYAIDRCVEAHLALYRELL